jgi:hypothetical protein
MASGGTRNESLRGGRQAHQRGAGHEHRVAHQQRPPAAEAVAEQAAAAGANRGSSNRGADYDLLDPAEPAGSWSRSGSGSESVSGSGAIKTAGTGLHTGFTA